MRHKDDVRRGRLHLRLGVAGLVLLYAAAIYVALKVLAIL